MDILEVIYKNMDTARRKHYRWATITIALSFLLLAVSLQALSLKDEFSVFGTVITLSEPQLLFGLLTFLTISYCSAWILEIHVYRLQTTIRKLYSENDEATQLSDKDWTDCVERATVLNIIFADYVSGERFLRELPGFAVCILIGFVILVIPFIAIASGLFRLYSLLGMTWWLAPFGLLVVVSMVFYLLKNIFKYRST